MPLEFPKLRCFCFIVALITLLVLSQHFFKEQLLAKTHFATLYLQKDEDPNGAKFNFVTFFDNITDGKRFQMIFLIICAFTSRERFWYYLLAT